MSPPEPRWRRLPEERPQQILQAALEVFEQQGLSRARLDDIAKLAGVSKGTIYLYFPNKEELFREVVRATFGETLALTEQRLDQGTPTEQIGQFIRTFWDNAMQQGYTAVFRIITGEMHLFPDLAEFYYTEVVQRTRELVARIIREGVKRGEFREIDPVIASRMLSSMCITNAMWCKKQQYFPNLPQKSTDEVRDELIDFYLHALRP